MIRTPPAPRLHRTAAFRTNLKLRARPQSACCTFCAGPTRAPPSPSAAAEPASAGRLYLPVEESNRAIFTCKTPSSSRCTATSTPIAPASAGSKNAPPRARVGRRCREARCRAPSRASCAGTSLSVSAPHSACLPRPAPTANTPWRRRARPPLQRIPVNPCRRLLP